MAEGKDNRIVGVKVFPFTAGYRCWYVDSSGAVWERMYEGYAASYARRLFSQYVKKEQCLQGKQRRTACSGK